MLEKQVPQAGCAGYGGFGGKKLGRETAGQPHKGHEDEQAAAAENIAHILAHNSYIDDIGDDDGNQKVKSRLQHFEKGRENTGRFMIFQIDF